jgi:AcrR family transcriptional regulator
MAKTRRRMRKEDRRKDILRVAADVFARKGYRPTTVNSLVEEAGISKGLFYIYFDSKKQAFIELIESYFVGFAEVLEENHRKLEELFAGNPSGPEIVQTWRENVYGILKYHVDNPSLTIVVYQEALGSDEDFSERVNELSERANKMVIEEFEMMTKRKVIREIDAEMVAAAAMGGIVYIIRELLLRKKWTDIKRLADQIVDYQSRALGPVGMDMDRLLHKLPTKS